MSIAKLICIVCALLFRRIADAIGKQTMTKSLTTDPDKTIL